MNGTVYTTAANERQIGIDALEHFFRRGLTLSTFYLPGFGKTVAQSRIPAEDTDTIKQKLAIARQYISDAQHAYNGRLFEESFNDLGHALIHMALAGLPPRTEWAEKLGITYDGFEKLAKNNAQGQAEKEEAKLYHLLSHNFLLLGEIEIQAKELRKWSNRHNSVTGIISDFYSVLGVKKEDWNIKFLQAVLNLKNPNMHAINETCKTFDIDLETKQRAFASLPAQKQVELYEFCASCRAHFASANFNIQATPVVALTSTWKLGRLSQRLFGGSKLVYGVTS